MCVCVCFVKPFCRLYSLFIIIIINREQNFDRFSNVIFSFSLSHDKHSLMVQAFEKFSFGPFIFGPSLSLSLLFENLGPS